MSTTFPGAIDYIAGLGISDAGNNPHQALHMKLGDAVMAMQTAMFGMRLDLAASVVVPGATSYSIRNHANTLDNLIITDAGNATLRGTLSLATAAGRIIPGATSISLRNNANTADNFLILDSGQFSHNVAVPLAASAAQSFSIFTTQMPQLASQFGADTTNTFRAYDLSLISDTTANGYGGIMNSVIAHLDIYSVGATWAKVEALAGVVNTKSSATGTISDGYGTSGEILHAGTSTITVIRGISGNVQLTAAGNIGTAYGTDSVISTTLGQTGTITVKAAGSRSFVQVNNTNAIQWVIGAENYIDLNAATTVTTNAIGAYNYVQNNSLTSTVTGNTYGALDEVNLTGAAVTTAAVYGVYGHLTIAGTAVGGSTNAAINAEVINSAAATTTQGIIGVNVRWRVGSLITQTLAIGINVMAPAFANTPTVTTGYGIRINDLSTTGSGTVTTSYGLRIENQAAASTTAYSLFVAGGRINMTSTNGAALFTSTSQNLTVSTTSSGTIAITSAGALNMTSVAASTWAHSGGSLAITATSQALTISTATSGTLLVSSAGALQLLGTTATVQSTTATPAGGSAAASLLFGTTAGFGIYYGSGAPTVSAAAGSIYIRTDNAGASLRLYSNTTGSTTWAAITSA